MKTTRWTLVALVGCAIALQGATCDKNGAAQDSKKTTQEESAGAKPAATGTSEGAQQKAPASETGGEAASGNAALTLSGVPGMDFSELPAPAQRELAAVFSDEFCYCGCPHTLGACLKQHTTCKHAKRMALLAADMASGGSPSTEIIVSLSKYYLSFREKRLPFTPDPRMCLGAADAKVTLVEFSDFECPYCAAAAPMLEDFARKNSNVRLCYAPFPLDGHPNARPAAQAALFAREHGKFWEMHDLIFENQTSLSREKLLELAERLGLQKAELAKVFDSGQYLDELKASKEAGKVAGVDSTPSLYVNGRKYRLGFGTEQLRHTVEDELEWMANGGAWAKD